MTELLRELLSDDSISDQELICLVHSVRPNLRVFNVTQELAAQLESMPPTSLRFIDTKVDVVSQITPLLSPKSPNGGVIKLQLPKSHELFIKDKCTKSRTQLVSLDRVYSLYSEHEKSINYKPVVRNTFEAALLRLGFLVTKFKSSDLAEYPDTIVDPKCVVYTNCVPLSLRD